MALHKKLTHKKRTDLGTDLNDYDLSFLPTPALGPFICEKGLIEVFDLEYFDDDLLQDSRWEFQKSLVKSIGLDDFKKIEEGLKHYVTTTKSQERELLILKKSLLQFDSGWLESFKSHTSDLSIQHLDPSNLEKFDVDVYKSISESELIPLKSLKKYIALATKITKKYLDRYAKYSSKKHRGESLINSYDEIIVSRGFNNSKYYMPNNEKPDILSHYLVMEKEGEVFFERSLFSSYSLCTRSSEAFMVAFHSRRRAIIKGYISTIEDRIFSSFIVSPAFYELQFEILALPSLMPLYIFSEEQNEIEHNFKLSTNGYPQSLL